MAGEQRVHSQCTLSALSQVKQLDFSLTRSIGGGVHAAQPAGMAGPLPDREIPLPAVAAGCPANTRGRVVDRAVGIACKPMFQVTGAPTTRAGPPGKTSTSLRRCSLKQLFMEPSAGLLITAVMHSENNTETDSVAHCASSNLIWRGRQEWTFCARLHLQRQTYSKHNLDVHLRSSGVGLRHNHACAVGAEDCQHAGPKRILRTVRSMSSMSQTRAFTADVKLEAPRHSMAVPAVKELRNEGVQGPLQRQASPFLHFALH